MSTEVNHKIKEKVKEGKRILLVTQASNCTDPARSSRTATNDEREVSRVLLPELLRSGPRRLLPSAGDMLLGVWAGLVLPDPFPGAPVN